MQSEPRDAGAGVRDEELGGARALPLRYRKRRGIASHRAYSSEQLPRSGCCLASVLTWVKITFYSKVRTFFTSARSPRPARVLTTVTVVKCKCSIR